MQIFVNDERLEAQLSGETHLNQVYDSIGKWTAGNNKYLLGFLVDGQEVMVEDLHGIEISMTDRIDFFIGDEVDMMITTIEELDRYLDQIGNTLFLGTECTETDLNNLNEGVHWIRQIMGSISSILKIDLETTTVPVFEVSQSLSNILDNLEGLSESLLINFTPETVDEFLEYLRGIKFFALRLGMQLRTMHADMDELIDIIDEFDREMDGLLSEIASINESFNSGNDQEALDMLQIGSEKLNRYLSVIYALDLKVSGTGGESLFTIERENRALSVVAEQITQLLRNLSEALEKNDLVTAGDILEYELTESLSILKPYLPEIRQFVVARKQGV